MELKDLSDHDRALLGQALRAAAYGPLFPDWEFHTLFGLQRNGVRAIADAGPDLVASSEDTDLAVNDSLNNLLGYPRGEDAIWPQWISVDRQQLRELPERVRGRDDESYVGRMK